MTVTIVVGEVKYTAELDFSPGTHSTREVQGDPPEVEIYSIWPSTRHDPMTDEEMNDWLLKDDGKFYMMFVAAAEAEFDNDMADAMERFDERGEK